MTVVRWILGFFAVLFAAVSLFGLGLSVAFDSKLWGDRAKLFRQALWLTALLWFNIEVWGRVIWTIVHWK